MIQKKSWADFRNTGLLLIINQVLQCFGWCIAVDINKENEIVDVYPARTNYRGFDNDAVTNAHKQLGTYLHENSKDLKTEANE